jgi:uncharacterized protein with WD repeat
LFRAKKERKKAAQEAEEAARAELEKLKMASEAAAKADAEAKAAAEPVDKDKLLKKLNKQLKAIDAVKEKVASGIDLNAEQKAKLATEDEIKAKIAELEAST